MWHSNKKNIIFFAYCNRFVFPLISFFVPILVGGNDRIRLLYLGVSFFVLSVYNIVGVLFEWKHIYCAHQSMSHKKMTPDNIQWDTVSFADKYGMQIVFIAFSIILVICYFLM